MVLGGDDNLPSIALRVVRNVPARGRPSDSDRTGRRPKSRGKDLTWNKPRPRAEPPDDPRHGLEK